MNQQNDPNTSFNQALKSLLERGEIIAVYIDEQVRYKTIENTRPSDYEILATPQQLKEDMGHAIQQVQKGGWKYPPKTAPAGELPPQ